MSFLSGMYPGDTAMLLALVVTAQVAVVVVVAWLAASLRARRRPALRHAIWLCALCAVSLTPLISSVAARTGLTAWTIARHPVTAGRAESPRGQRNSQLLVSTDQTAGKTAGSLETTGPRPPVSDDGRVGLPIESADSWSTPDTALRATGGVLAIVWVIGLMVQAVRLLFGWAWIIRERRRAAPVVEHGVHNLLAEVVRQLGLKHAPALAVRPGGGHPLVVGVWRPAILLPAQWLDEGNREALRQVLLHESAHVARHDVLIGLAQRFVAAVFWPHPLVHVLNRELSRAREETCDNYVLAAFEPAAFSETLLAFACEPATFWPQPGIGLRSGAWRLEDRVAGLLDAGRSRATRIGAKTAVAGAVASVLLVGAMAGISPSLAESEPTAVPPAAADVADAETDASPNPFTNFIVDENDPHAGLLKLGARLQLDDAKRLIAVDLSRTAVTDADLAQLKNWPHIEELSLAHTGVTDAGMTHVQHLRKLVVLDISHTRVTQKGLAYTQYLGRLQSINMEGTGIERLNYWESPPPDDLIDPEGDEELPNPFEGGGGGGGFFGDGIGGGEGQGNSDGGFF